GGRPQERLHRDLGLDLADRNDVTGVVDPSGESRNVQRGEPRSRRPQKRSSRISPDEITEFVHRHAKERCADDRRYWRHPAAGLPDHIFAVDGSEDPAVVDDGPGHARARSRRRQFPEVSSLAPPKRTLDPRFVLEPADDLTAIVYANGGTRARAAGQLAQAAAARPQEGVHRAVFGGGTPDDVAGFADVSREGVEAAERWQDGEAFDGGRERRRRRLRGRFHGDSQCQRKSDADSAE